MAKAILRCGKIVHVQHKRGGRSGQRRRGREGNENVFSAALVYSHKLGGTLCAHVARENTCTR
jgi:hypothetical protein